MVEKDKDHIEVKLKTQRPLLLYMKIKWTVKYVHNWFHYLD